MTLKIFTCKVCLELTDMQECIVCVGYRIRRNPLYPYILLFNSSSNAFSSWEHVSYAATNHIRTSKDHHDFEKDRANQGGFRFQTSSMVCMTIRSKSQKKKSKKENSLRRSNEGISNPEAPIVIKNLQLRLGSAAVGLQRFT